MTSIKPSGQSLSFRDRKWMETVALQIKGLLAATINPANYPQKSVNETITGNWTFGGDITFSGEVTFTGTFNYPTIISGWTATNTTEDRSFDAQASSSSETARVLATLINDLKTGGILGG